MKENNISDLAPKRTDFEKVKKFEKWIEKIQNVHRGNEKKNVQRLRNCNNIMDHSKLQKQLAEIFVLSSSLINRLDEINITESGKELKDKAEQFTQVLEPLLEK